MTARVILGITIRQEFRSCYAAARRLLARYYEDHPELADSRTSVSDFAAVSLAGRCLARPSTRVRERRPSGQCCPVCNAPKEYYDDDAKSAAA